MAKAKGIGLFVLKKQLEAVLLFSRDAGMRWVEEVRVSTGITPDGQQVKEDESFDTALSQCFLELGFFTSTSVEEVKPEVQTDPPASDTSDAGQADAGQLVIAFLLAQRAVGVEFDTRIDRGEVNGKQGWISVLCVSDGEGRRTADRDWVRELLAKFLTEQNIIVDDDSLQIMWDAVHKAASRKY